MNDDELRRRLADADPTSAEPDLSTDDPGARALLEEIMNAPLDITDTAPSIPPPAPARGRRSRWLAPVTGVAAAAVLVLGGLGLTGALGSSDGGTLDAPLAVQLSLGEGQDPLASCLRVDAEVLRGVSVAFAGDVTAIEGETVTLQVTRWYTGGDAPNVQLTAPAGLEALLGTVDFEVGAAYLVSSGDGATVNYCGWSGRATPELRQIYDTAFPG